ncbi:alpha/beta hydrolase [Streptomyces beijiangensis]|uniref:Alpha/beta fold hydrolase n=1 Tax=Streptomyces beijiangensis TaxID=163361 RepID=A0A939FA76_9ACTN|nr:alpha/beta hydrolase [Streptomyces beijiangensis]MBO0514544.1 alpha/beta fold hydrolase [Streptomyces beijiangensis]
MHRLIRTGSFVATAALVLLTGCDSDSGTKPEAKDTTTPAPTSSAPASRPTGSALPASLTSQKPDWGHCKDGRSGWTCANVKVPLDYAHPAGATISLALVRKEAKDKSRRLGSLLFNFGGPGGSGVDILPDAAAEYGNLNTRYDLVSWDPRGVSRSAGVVCRTDSQQAGAERDIDLTPDTPAEEAAYFKDAADFGQGCEERSGKVLPYVTTSNTARDLDLMRTVLGDAKLNYFGFSYGTELGGTYAHLFPKNVGRTVLDAVVDPTADAVGHARNQTIGFQRALDDYLKSTGQDPKAGTAKIAALLGRLDKKPLPTKDGRKLNQSLALTGIVMPLYSKSSWSYLTQGLREAEQQGTGNLLLGMADAYNDRDENGHYSTQSSSQRAIDCADTKNHPTEAQAKALLPSFRELSPVFGEFLAWDTAGWCNKWPVTGELDHPVASAQGAGQVLVVGTTGDPATPYEGARKMADALGAGVGVLLTNKGEGHGAYHGGSGCVAKKVDGYLLDGRVPADGTTCS